MLKTYAVALLAFALSRHRTGWPPTEPVCPAPPAGQCGAANRLEHVYPPIFLASFGWSFAHLSYSRKIASLASSCFFIFDQLAAN